MRGARLEAQCARYVRYLVGRDPGEAVLVGYVEGIRLHPDWFEPRSPLDHTVAVAERHLPLRAIDAFSRVFAPEASSRRRMVFVLALLENASETFELLDLPAARSPGRFWLGLVPRVLWSGASLIAALVVILPMHALRRMSGS